MSSEWLVLSKLVPFIQFQNLPYDNPQETHPPPKLWAQFYWFKYLYCY